MLFFFFQAEDGIRDSSVTGVQTCALPICWSLLIAALALVALKLWLAAAQPAVAHANASFDARLDLALAEQVLKGNWLGPYSQFTLLKVPTYSLVHAGAFFSVLPLPLAQHRPYL